MQLQYGLPCSSGAGHNAKAAWSLSASTLRCALLLSILISFVQKCTMEEMIDHCAQFMDEVNKMMPEPMTQEQYKEMMRGFFPRLKRWR